MKKKMTKKEAVALFKDLCPREKFVTKYSNGKESLDTVARSEAWNNFTDSLCKEGKISDWQYNNWTNPF